MKKFLILFVLLLALPIYAAENMCIARTNAYVAGASTLADAIAPVLNSCSIATNGTTWTFNFSEDVEGSAAEFQVVTGDTSVTGAKAFTYTSGTGTAQVIMEADEAANSGETAHVDYTQPGGGIRDIIHNDLASITGKTCTNNSEEGAPSNGVIGTIAHDSTASNDYTSLLFSDYTTTTAGTVSYAHYYGVGTAADVCISLHDTSGNLLLLCSGNNGAGTGWKNIACTGTYDIVAATTYWVAQQIYDNVNYYRDADGGHVYRDNSYTFDCVSPLTPIAIDETASTGPGLTIIFNNTAGSPE